MFRIQLPPPQYAIALCTLLCLLVGCSPPGGTSSSTAISPTTDANTATLASRLTPENWLPITPVRFPQQLLGSPVEAVNRKDGEKRRVTVFTKTSGGELSVYALDVFDMGKFYFLYDDTVAYWIDRFDNEHNCYFMAGWGSRVIFNISTRSQGVRANIFDIGLAADNEQVVLNVEVDAMGVHGDKIRLRLGEIKSFTNATNQDIIQIQQQVEKARDDWYDAGIEIRPVIFAINPGSLPLAEARSRLQDWIQSADSELNIPITVPVNSAGFDFVFNENTVRVDLQDSP